MADPPKKKLYEVVIEKTVYVYAEDEVEAASIGEDAVEDDGVYDCGRAQEVTHRDWPLAADWNGKCLVYGPQEDIYLDDLLKALPEDENHKRLMQLHHSLEPDYHANKKEE